MNSRFLLSIAAVLLVLSLAFSAEKMLCGFEPEELVSWPNLTILDTNGNDIGYGGPASVGFMVSRDTLEATQGDYVFKNTIYAGAVPADFLSVRRYASRFQDWSQLVNDWDPLRVPLGEYGGPADWLCSRFTNIFAMYHVLNQMPLLNNWTGYKWLCVDVRTTEAPATLRVQVEGAEKLSHYRHYQVTPNGWQTLCFPLAEVAWVQGLDLSLIVNLRIILCNTTGPTTLFMDNIRLTDGDTAASPYAQLLDNSPLFPWEIGSGWWGKSPLTETPPPVYVPTTRVTGPVTPSFSGRIASGRSGYGASISYEDRYNIIPYDNNRLMVARPMVVRTGNSSFPNRSTPRAAMRTVDQGLTWTNFQGQAGVLPTPLDNYCVQWSATPQWIMGDNLLRGNGYFMEMEWCSARGDGAGVPLFWHFFKIALTGEQAWQVFPSTPPPDSAPQKPQRVIAGYMPRTCDVAGPCLIALPNGRLWSCAGTYRAHGSFAYEASYSDDGGVHWRYAGDRPFLHNASGPLSLSGKPLLLPFAGNVGMVFYMDAVLNLVVGDGSQWEPVITLGRVGWSKTVECASYKDSTLFFLIGDVQSTAAPRSLYLSRFKQGAYALDSTPIVTGNIGNYCMSLCGQTLWALWTDSDQNAIQYRIYHIPSSTWLTSAQTLVQETSFPILYIQVPMVAPPAYMPVAWILNGPVPAGYANENLYFNDPSFPVNPDPFALKTAMVPIPPEQASLDADYDGLDDAEEAVIGTNPGNPDSDGDHLLDGQEVVLLGTNPLDKDTDHDGDDDDVELYYYTSPADAAKRATVNQIPAASLTTDITSGPAPLTVHFDAAASQDNEGDALQYIWNLGHTGEYWDYGVKRTESLEMDGGNRMVYTFRQEGVYPVRLTIKDGRGGVAEQTVTITVSNGSGVALLANQTSAFFSSSLNPFSETTALQFGLKAKGNVSLKIYDVRGKLVKVLVSGEKPSGIHRVIWKPDRILSSGIYCAVYRAGNQVITKKMVFSR